jgi:hypothetical protein
MSIPLPHAQSCSCPVPILCPRPIFFCAAGPTLQVPFSFLHSTFSGSSHHHYTGWSIYRLNELLVSPMIENEVSRLATKGFLPDRLILELALKVIISVIVKFTQDKMWFCCSDMFHEVNQLLAVRLATQRQLGLIPSLRARERIHAWWARSQ